MSASRRKRPRVPHRKRLRARRCVICGSGKEIQEHHLGGQKHASHFTVSLCRSHHEAVTLAISRAGVNMRYTSDKEERARRARLATYVFLWFLEDALNH